MRKIQLVLAIALMGLVTFSGCKKKSDSTPSYTMSAKVDGATVNLTLCSAAVVSGNLAITGVTVSGGVGGPPEINFSVPSWNGAAGTFTFPATTSVTDPFAQYIASTTGTYISTAGSLVITSVSTTAISGTFSFTATDLLTSTSKAITAGTFTAKR